MSALRNLIVSVFIVLATITAWTAEDTERYQSIETFLQDFHSHPAEVMDRLPPEVRPDGSTRERGTIPDLQSPEGQALLWQRSAVREQIIQRSALARQPSILALPLERDDPLTVVHDKKLVRSIFELSKAGWDKGQPSFTLWADSYWPRNRGVIGSRYADPAFPNSSNWTTNHSFVQRKPASSYIPGSISKLSPAEKYDLLIGDRSWGLTQSAWEVGRQSLNKWGFVPNWEGICHGWSAANHMNFPKPGGSANFTSVEGYNIKFYESDLKGLASYLWAEVYVDTNISGRVCRKDSFRKDAVGRILDEECLDANPSSWHLLVTNQVGRLGKSFVVDVNFDSAIWNYGVAKYRLTYFNPQSLKPTDKPGSAIVPIGNFTMDKFKSYRPPEAKYVIGVAMEVSHPDATAPRTGPHQEEPQLSTVRFVYDLELNENYEVIGGEWYINAHPDFMWSFAADAAPTALADRLIGNQSESWDPGQALPRSWAEAAQKSSVKGQPSRLIIERMIQATQSEAEAENLP